jgi:hypothetical protein
MEARATAEMQAMFAQVAVAKSEAKAALDSANATWQAYLANQQAQIAATKASLAAGDGQLPQHLLVLEADVAAGPRALAKRKRVFMRNLEDINKLNAESGDLLAFGVNDFTHLTDREFKKIYLSSFIPPTGADWGG